MILLMKICEQKFRQELFQPLKKVDDGLKIVSKSHPSYTQLTRQNQTQGKVKLVLKFKNDGRYVRSHKKLLKML
jgi:ribosomal protein L31